MAKIFLTLQDGQTDGEVVLDMVMREAEADENGMTQATPAIMVGHGFKHLWEIGAMVPLLGKMGQHIVENIPGSTTEPAAIAVDDDEDEIVNP